MKTNIRLDLLFFTLKSHTKQNIKSQIRKSLFIPLVQFGEENTGTSQNPTIHYKHLFELTVKFLSSILNYST